LGTGGSAPPAQGEITIRVTGQLVRGVFRPFVPGPATALYQRTPSGNVSLTGQFRTGRGEVFKLTQGDFRLEIETQFYQSETRDVTFDPNVTRRVQIELTPNVKYPFPSSSTLPFVSGPARLHGSLRATNGDPLSAVLVTVAELENLNPAWPFRSFRTDQTGSWVIVFPDKFFQAPNNPRDVVPEKPVNIRFDLPSGTVTIAAFPVKAGKEIGLLQPSLRGNAVNAKGDGITGVQISVVGQSANSQTDKSGTFLYFFPLTQGQQRVTVRARAPGGAQLSQDVDLVARGRAVVPTFRFT
jgi:hypothetical protein